VRPDDDACHEVDAPTRVRGVKPGARLVSFSRHRAQGSHARAEISASNRTIRGLTNNMQTYPVLIFVHSNQLLR